MALRRRVGQPLVVVALAFGILITIFVSRALAYNGEFCYSTYLYVLGGPKQPQFCVSNQESNIRRAVGHGADWTQIKISTQDDGTQASCSSDGCTADTGYLSKDGTGVGTIVNQGDPCGCGGGTYYGWLYP